MACRLQIEKSGFIGYKWHLFDENGTPLFADLDYDTFVCFSNMSYIIVGKNDKYGTMNKYGKLIEPLIYPEVIFENL